MYYDKGPQLTAGNLKQFLANIPDDVKIRVGIGDNSKEAHYLVNDGGELLIHAELYMQDASETNLLTLISFQK